MSKNTAWWVYLGIPIILTFILPPTLPLTWYAGVGVYHFVRFLVKDHQNVASGRSSGLWRMFVIFGLIAFAGLGYLAKAYDEPPLWLLCLGSLILLSPILWWIFGPLIRIFARKSSMTLQQRREEADRQQQREAHAREAPLRQQAHEQTASAEKRRLDARASALLSFTFYSAKLGNRFSRQDFDQYLTTYMGDTQPAETVEERGRALLEIFERHLADIEPAKKDSSLESITQWYQATKAQIRNLPIDAEVKEERLAELERRFSELLSQHMERVHP